MTPQEIKQRLKSRLRQRVPHPDDPHPDDPHRTVRVTEVNRTGLSYNDGDKSTSIRWEDLTSEQAGRMIGQQTQP
jgi:hypothetical protein